MKKLALSLLGLSLIWACNNSTEAETTSAESIAASEALNKEVLELHDKVMPEMTPMMNLSAELSQASVGRADSIQFMTAATELRFAKEAMMTWMRDFSGNFSEEWTEEEKIAFLKNEKAKMERIDAKTQEALSNGRALMATLNAAETAADSVAPVK